MNNKKIVRNENTAGTFTTVQYNILRNKNLTSNAKILMIEVFSDTSKFRFSESLYMKRMGIKKSAFYKALDNLEANEFLRRTKIGKTNKNFYTFSEFGNLNGKDANETPIEKNKEEVIDENTSEPIRAKIVLNELEMDVIQGVFKDNTNFNNDSRFEEFEKLIYKEKDFYQLKSSVEKMFQREKKKHFKDCKAKLQSSFAGTDKSKSMAFELMKEAIFDKGEFINDPFKYLRRAQAKINKNKPIDIESLSADRLGGQPMDDLIG